MRLILKDRQEAGYKLAEILKDKIDKNTIALGLPRGGVPIAKIISRKLQIEFNVYISKKIPHPANEEFAIGAIGELGQTDVNPSFEVPQNLIQETKDKIKLYREICRIKPLPNLKDKTVILVDDGVATGLSMLVAIKDIKNQNPKKIIVAVGAAPVDTCQKLKVMAECYSLILSDNPFFSVGAYYNDFHQLSDKQVMEYLKDEQ